MFKLMDRLPILSPYMVVLFLIQTEKGLHRHTKYVFVGNGSDTAWDYLLVGRADITVANSEAMKGSATAHAVKVFNCLPP